MSETPETMGKRFARVIRAIMTRVIDRTAVHASSHMVVPGGRDTDANPVQADKLTTRSGRLLRAVLGAGGMAWKSPESTRRITQQNQYGMGVEIEIAVPYAKIHEEGGTIPAYSLLITPKMRRFFWAMWYETREDKWKGAALKRGGVTMPARTVEARPYIAPALADVRDDLGQIMREELRREFGA